MNIDHIRLCNELYQHHFIKHERMLEFLFARRQLNLQFIKTVENRAMQMNAKTT